MKLPKKTFDTKFKTQHGRCYYCGANLHFCKIEVDHKIPFSKSRDGRNTNLCLACSFCNNMKSDMSQREFHELMKIKHPDKLIRGMFYYQFINIGPYYE